MTETTTDPVPRQIMLQRVYLKDASLEMPLAPQIFARQWTPQVEIQMSTGIGSIETNMYHVQLTVTVTAKLEADTAFLVEVHQCGIFAATGFPDEELQAVLSTYCANILFPYARETISNLITRTGYPPIVLQPVNFDALYAEHLARSNSTAAVDFTPPGVVVQ